MCDEIIIAPLRTWGKFPIYIIWKIFNTVKRVFHSLSHMIEDAIEPPFTHSLFTTSRSLGRKE
jgi:hypothetical protein